MKILIVNTSDIQGGAARAAYRLHRSLLDANIDSQMLVQSKASDDYTVITEDSRLRRYLNKLRPIIDGLPVRKYKNKTKTLFSPSWFGFNNIVTKINKINPDIVHLHWINGGMLKIEDIAKIKTPIIWSLHDNWAFTGGCHIKWDCDKYKQHCQSCPNLDSKKEKDLSFKVFRRKKKVFTKKDFIIVGLSSWLNNLSKQSFLLKNNKHINLPNPINTDIFKPFDKELSRKLWNLPKDKKLILFGAMDATRDINKGFKQLNEALQKIAKTDDIELVVFGSTKPNLAPDFGFKANYLGQLNDDVSLVTLYSAVDVMVVPSLQENLSNTIMESLSCGTPVVAFDIGGNNDMIDHNKNGYLAKPFDSQDLANGIEWVLANDSYVSLCENARYKVLREFDSKVVAQKYIQLYKETLGR
ncbi:glycosyltransferase family 4 protein [Francisella hispaniensis]|uniref:glycosyltransferase family 4 protein n=1 Tax=Francisella hispaniensis TaxID=622488 RepID=UPI00190611E5|nr:glycosyltransferase family 4 protein [Francisella hispaniensis]MBK2357533.1 glycosyltransferase family 4 protein [Francisella hispaniensis]